MSQDWSRIQRHLLDFQSPPVCCQTGRTDHIYMNLLTGSLYQGRGVETPAYRHSIETGDNLWMRLHDQRFFLLPDGVEIQDEELEDIKYECHPEYTREDLLKIQKNRTVTALDGGRYVPGLIGLKGDRYDYLNVVVRMFLGITPFRDFLLVDYQEGLQKNDQVLASFARLARALHNPSSYRSDIGARDFCRTVALASDKLFTDEQRDPIAFFSWLKHQFETVLVQAGLPVLTSCFAGSVRTDLGVKQPFVLLQVPIPLDPVFQELSGDIELTELLCRKFGGKPQLVNLPQYLVIQLKRFQKNNYFWEKARLRIRFPIASWDLQAFVEDGNSPALYDLKSCIVHDGDPKNGSYRIYLKQGSSWFNVVNDRVDLVAPDEVTGSDIYVLMFELQTQV